MITIEYHSPPYIAAGVLANSNCGEEWQRGGGEHEKEQLYTNGSLFSHSFENKYKYIHITYTTTII